VLVRGPASFAPVQRSGIGLWSALMSTGRVTTSLAGHPGDLFVLKQPIRPVDGRERAGPRAADVRGRPCRCAHVRAAACHAGRSPCIRRCVARGRPGLSINHRLAKSAWSVRRVTAAVAPAGQRSGCCWVRLCPSVHLAVQMAVLSARPSLALRLPRVPLSWPPCASWWRGAETHRPRKRRPRCRR